ncbi:hypothetical protein ABGV40_15015 [Paenibacillus amylolyticus]|uniref:hypothetical protein n=1 Tax=Paenibacillus amylolyticus TaxID=1451 RepID=UPI0032420CB2
MNRQAIALTDDQAAIVIQRGTAITLNLVEAASVDYETGKQVTASSFTITNIEGLRELRDALNKMPLGEKKDQVKASTQLDLPSPALWKPIKENALNQLSPLSSYAQYQMLNALSVIVRNTVGIPKINDLTEETQPKAQAIVDVIVDAMLELRMED